MDKPEAMYVEVLELKAQPKMVAQVMIWPFHPIPNSVTQKDATQIRSLCEHVDVEDVAKAYGLKASQVENIIKAS